MNKFNTPILVRIDGVWRPVWGKSIILGNKDAISFILNGRIFLETKSSNWIYFDNSVTPSKLGSFAIKYNLNELNSIIRAKDVKERAKNITGIYERIRQRAATYMIDDEIIRQWAENDQSP